jgi:ERCC4-related helicase
VRDVLAGDGMQPLRLTFDEFVRFVIDEAHRATRIISAPPPS